jgi:hypothetical protein
VVVDLADTEMAGSLGGKLAGIVAGSMYNCRLGDRCVLKWRVVVNMLGGVVV